MKLLSDEAMCVFSFLRRSKKEIVIPDNPLISPYIRGYSAGIIELYDSNSMTYYGFNKIFCAALAELYYRRIIIFDREANYYRIGQLK